MVVRRQLSNRPQQTIKRKKIHSLRMRGSAAIGAHSTRSPKGKALDGGTGGSSVDAFIQAEDRELERLSKLLGIDKNKACGKATEKLNREYEKLEGLGENFADFLLDLDRISAPSGAAKRTKRAKTGASTTEKTKGENDTKEATRRFKRGVESSQPDTTLRSSTDSSKAKRAKTMADSRSAGSGHSGGGGSGGKEEEDEDLESSGAESTGTHEFGSDSSQSRMQEEEEETGSVDAAALLEHTYQPTQGEDIYGRVREQEECSGSAARKYLPPARRRLSQIDQSSDSYVAVKRQINGLVNKLSDQSKDTIVRAIQKVYDLNSNILVNTALRDAVMATCIDSTKLMVPMVQVAAAVVAALHSSVGTEVGSFFVESIVRGLREALTQLQNVSAASAAAGAATDPLSSSSSTEVRAHALITSKKAANLVLFLVYLHNFRVVYHTIVVEVLMQLAGCSTGDSSRTLLEVLTASEHHHTAEEATRAPAAGGRAVVAVEVNGESKGKGEKKVLERVNSRESAVLGEHEAELIECIVSHCGLSLRASDPLALKAVADSISRRIRDPSSAPSPSSSSSASISIAGDGGSSRLRFMCESLADLRSNKSRRLLNAHDETVKRLRKWLGSLKTVSARRGVGSATTAGGGGGAGGGDASCLRLTLDDVVHAEERGRWWLSGARWAKGFTAGSGTTAGVGAHEAGPERDPKERMDREGGHNHQISAGAAAVAAEQEQLLQLAKKLKMNTDTRRNVFVVLMSSRDVEDAFERLLRLELKGKSDREVVRVLVECCLQERRYNEFYPRLAARLCAHNRQHKATLTYTFWDQIKIMTDFSESEGLLRSKKKTKSHRISNCARLLSDMVTAFILPLSLIKPIDITQLNEPLVSFLSIFFTSLFYSKISDAEFQVVLDRVAASADFSIVRDGIQVFLQRYLVDVPAPAAAPEDSSAETTTTKTTAAADARKSTARRRRKMVITTMQHMRVLDSSSAATTTTHDKHALQLAPPPPYDFSIHFSILLSTCSTLAQTGRCLVLYCCRRNRVIMQLRRNLVGRVFIRKWLHVRRPLFVSKSHSSPFFKLSTSTNKR